MLRTPLIKRTNYYVYIWFRLDGRPLYVGKGKWRKVNRQRWEDHFRYPAMASPIVYAMYQKAEDKLPCVIWRDNLTEAEAFATEVALIAAIGRKELGNGPLVNLSPGGDGSTPGPATRAKMSKAGKGRVKSEEHRRKIGDSHRGLAKPKSKFNLPTPEESSIKVAAWHARMTPEEKAARAKKISEATKKAMADPDVSARISRAMRGRKHSEEHRQKNSQALKLKHQTDPDFHARVLVGLSTASRFKGKQHSPETRAKMSATRLALSAAHRQILEDA